MITINNTMPGVIKNIEVKGNTYQDPNNLSKIVSAGISNGDGTYKMSILSSNGLGKADINYKETKCDITLPRPLRSTFDKSVKDRLYYDKKSKNWCIEQNVDDESNILGDGVSIIHQLPKDIDIFLESYAERTDVWVESGEISAITKVTASKSMASTVLANTNEINILNGKIADIQGLKESQDFAYETDKGYLVCKDTQNGVVKNLKICGKSLVNKATNVSNYSTNLVRSLELDIEVNSEYTIVAPWVNKYTDISYCIAKLDGTGNIFSTYIKDYTKTFTISDTYSKYALFIKGSTADATAIKEELNKYLILKGNHTQNPPGYFEGIANVGNGNEIEVSSIKWSGNLFNEEQLKPYIKSENDIEYEINYEKVWTDKAKLAQLPFKENTQYKFICSQKTSTSDSKPRFYFVYTDGSKDEITIATTEYTEVTGLSRANKTLDYISVTYGVSGAKFTVKKNSICLYENTSKSTYESYKDDKKTILFKDTDNKWKPVTELNGIDSNNCDMVDSISNKYTKKYVKYKFTGNETIDYVTDYGDVSRFSISNIPVYSKLNAKILCDKFNVITIGTPNVEGINSHATIKNYASIQIKTNKLETKDREGFKKWLIANPTEITIELETPLEYEINPLFPNSYSDETMILFGSGAIAPYASWKITSHAANIIKNQGQRLTRLENDFYKYTVVQNRIMLDSRYAADNATFKIDTSIYSSNNVTASNLHASICEVKETHQDIKYDFDLYKLIKRNILVGKDNYDRAWMEECITFYWMDFKISDQMYAELNEIIENQYNPPVDMTPIEPPMEDIIEETPQA